MRSISSSAQLAGAAKNSARRTNQLDLSKRSTRKLRSTLILMAKNKYFPTKTCTCDEEIYVRGPYVIFKHQNITL